MAVQIQLRRGLAAQWTATNVLLAQGEMAVETDTKNFKVGDGINTWNNLPYSNVNTLGDLNDVSASNPGDGDLLIYDDNINKWVSQKDLDKQRIDGGHY
jgi:hypothetical protein